jgi:hypothetical protein
MNRHSNFPNTLPIEQKPAGGRSSPAARLRKQKIADMDRKNTPLFRRDSTTDAIIPLDLERSSFYDWDGSDSSIGSIESSLFLPTQFYNHFMDIFSQQQLEEELYHVRQGVKVEVSLGHALFLGQKGSEQSKARAVTRNQNEFQKLKTQLKDSGMVTNYATRAVLNSIVEECAEELRISSKNKERVRRRA